MVSAEKVIFTILVLFYASLTPAEISTKNLPSMENLATLLGSTNKKEVEKTVMANNGQISSGLPANNSARGKTGNEIAALLSSGAREHEKQILEAIMAERDSFEQILAQNRFVVNDFGVAYAASFITLWELASHKVLPLEGSLEAGKFLVYALKEVKPQYEALRETEKDQGYDWLMTTPVAFASLIKGFEKVGRIQEAEQLRTRSATLFNELFGLPYNVITISERGEIGVDTDKLLNIPDGSSKGDEIDTLIDQSIMIEEKNTGKKGGSNQ